MICSSRLPKMWLYCSLLHLFILLTIGRQCMNECSWSSLVEQPNTHCRLFLCIFLKLVFESWHLDLSLYSSCFSSLLIFFEARYNCSWNFLYVTLFSFVYPVFFHSHQSNISVGQFMSHHVSKISNIKNKSSYTLTAWTRTPKYLP